MPSLETLLTEPQRADWAALDTPFKIQSFLDSLPYIAEERNRSPLDVLRDRQCHCLDGGLLAAAALRRLGHRPLVMELWPEPGTDDDHVLAIFQQNGGWGAIAKSNFPGLRFREPVFRTRRELVMSYFEIFFNLDREKTLRSYSVPLDLRSYDGRGWEMNEPVIADIEQALHHLRTYPVLTPAMIAALNLSDERSFQAGIFGVEMKEAYKYRVGSTPVK